MNITVPALALVRLSSALAAAQKPTAAIYAAGSTPGSYSERTGAGRFDEIYSEWVLGFISSANAYTFHGIDLAGNLPNSSMLAWTENWCREHPLDHVATAAINLVGELIDHPPRPRESR